jgi:hypothetical protein
MIVHSAKQGPLRVVIEAHGGALMLFSPKHRTVVMRRAMRQLGNHWLHKWVPMRLSNYAFMLGYRVSGKWRTIKARYLTGVVPFIGMTPPGGGSADGPWWQRNKAKMADAITKGRVSVSGRDGNETAIIRIPYGHPIQTEKAKVFRTIAPNEMADLAVVLSKRIANEISGARTVEREGQMRKIPKPSRKTADRAGRKVA